MTQPCSACPFAYTEESEQVQNYGCLPSPYDIMQMKLKSGHNWACHEDESKMCLGFAREMQSPFTKVNVDLTQGGLITYTDWDALGEEQAILKAKERDQDAGN